MEGRARAAEREFERRLSQAWHTEAFAREKRLKPLKKYLEHDAPKDDPSRGAANLISTLREMQAKGMPISFRRVKLPARRPAEI